MVLVLRNICSGTKKRHLIQFLLSPILMAPFLPIEIHAKDVPKYGIFEISLTASRLYSNPYLQIPGDSGLPGFLEAFFTGPTGKKIQIEGFWDGGNTWKVRMSPTAVGAWTYITSSSDPGLNGVKGSFDCIATSNHGFVRIHPQNPYAFAYDDGTPFFWLGDTHIIFYDWKDRGDNSFRFDNGSFQAYFDTRASQGFTSLYFGSWIFRKPGNFAQNEGGYNFKGNDPDRLNQLFWQWTDRRLDYVVSRGISPGLGIGWPDQGILKFGNTRLMRAFRYLIARYAAYNIMWILFGEVNEGPVDLDYFGEAAKKFDPYNHITSCHHTGRFVSNAPWVDISVHQRSKNFASEIREDRWIGKPVVNVEFNWSSSYDRRRKSAWTIVTNGGHVGYGEDRQHVTRGLTYMEYLGDFFTKYTKFWLLQPHNELVKDGTGYCIANPGYEYVVYLPAGGSIMIDLSSVTGNLRAGWYDPRNGKSMPYDFIIGGGKRLFMSPATKDWVLHISRRN